MEEFTRVDIFDTKGVEYLFVIGYLLILIVFWNVAKNPRKFMAQVKSAISSLSAGILRIPQGIFFSRNHTWVHLGESGSARVGIDDFLQHVTGEVKLTELRQPGEKIRKGELLTGIDQEGKRLKLYSPISGTITDINGMVKETPGVINEDPYEKGWLYKIKPTDWVKETRDLYLGEEATEWSSREMVRFKDFLSGGPMEKYSTEPAMVILQDGGEMRDNILKDLPAEVWTDFQQEFLNIDRQ